MVNVETGTVPANRPVEREPESIITRFEGEKHSFYALGRVYLKRQQEIEDVFYRTIIFEQGQAHKRKNGQSAISIFLKDCQETSERSLSVEGDDAFQAFHHLEAGDKEALALVHVKGCSQEEASSILKITVDEVKSRLFSGIRKLRETMGYGSGFEGCHNYQKHYLDYLGRTMGRPEKVDFEIHIYHCRECQEDLASFQEVTLTLARLAEDIPLPEGFMERIRSRIDEREVRRQKRKKKRKTILLSIAGVFALLIMTGFVTGGFRSFYYSYTEEDEQLRAILQHGLGERLNLEAESDGVKITIRSIVADDVQTLVFYEVEDMKKENWYMMNSYEGIYIENERDIMNMESNNQYYSPPIDQDEIHNEDMNVYKGTMSLKPVAVDKGTIKLNVARLMQVPHDPKEGLAGERGMTFAEGDWSFEIPFEKQPSRVHKLDQVVEVGGIPFRLDKLTIAPTTTVLQYGFQNNRQKERIDMINFDSLIVNGEKKEANHYGGNMYVDSYDQQDWSAFTASFDTLYFDDPKEVTVQFGSIRLTVDDRKTIELRADADMPQTFEYQGNTVTIDEIKVGNPAHVLLTHDVSKKRKYENINYGFFNYNDPSENKNTSIGMSDVDGVLMDKDGNIHKPEEYVYDQMERPRYFETKQTIEFYNDASDEDIVPNELVIDGYSTTKYVDDLVKVKLD
jgi:Domain of unknown function (DUF4179)/Sigma-70, region 4